jgi:hypothetical protein
MINALAFTDSIPLARVTGEVRVVRYWERSGRDSGVTTIDERPHRHDLQPGSRLAGRVDECLESAGSKPQAIAPSRRQIGSRLNTAM